MSTPEAIVREFAERINSHDVAGIISLCSAHHRFVDSLGTVISGRARLQAAWSEYLALFPNYHMKIESLVASGYVVLLSGWASATLVADRAGGGSTSWRIPAAWRAEVRRTLVDVWQVYADNKPVYELLTRNA